MLMSLYMFVLFIWLLKNTFSAKFCVAYSDGLFILRYLTNGSVKMYKLFENFVFLEDKKVRTHFTPSISDDVMKIGHGCEENWSVSMPV